MNQKISIVEIIILEKEKTIKILETKKAFNLKNFFKKIVLKVLNP